MFGPESLTGAAELVINLGEPPHWAGASMSPGDQVQKITPFGDVAVRNVGSSLYYAPASSRLLFQS